MVLRNLLVNEFYNACRKKIQTIVFNIKEQNIKMKIKFKHFKYNLINI